MVRNRKIKAFTEQHLKKEIVELKEEGINTEIIPWIEDKKN